MPFNAGTLEATLLMRNQQFNTAIDNSSKKTNAFGKLVEKNSAKIKGMGIAMAATGGVILAGLTKASQGARDFNKEIANITTLTTPAITNVISLKEKIRDLSVDAAKDTSDVAGGAYQVASAFGEAALQGRSLEINVKGAAAGMATATEAINLTSAVTKGFGDTTDEAQQKVMDLSFVTVKLGQTTFPELAASIGKTVPLMAAMGGKQEELFAGFATLTGVTGSAAEVSTQFAGILGALIKPTGEMKEAIKQAGKEHLGLSDATGKTLVSEMGLVEAIKAIIATTDGSMTSLGKLIRRKEALTAVLALTGGQADVFTSKLSEMYKSEGAAGEAFEKISSGVNATGFAMEQAQIKMQIASQRLGEAVTPVLAEIKITIASVVEAIANWMKENPLLAKSIMGVTVALSGLMVVIGPMLLILPAIVKGYAALKTILTATVPVIVANKNAIAGLIPSHSVGQANKLGQAIKNIGPKIAKVAAAGAAFYVGWQVGKAIDDFLGLSDAIQKGVDALMPSLESYEKFSMMKMGFTEKGEQALFLRNSIIELGKGLDENVNGLKEAARAIKADEDAYNNLHPALKRVVDGMTQMRPAMQGVIDKGKEIPSQTEEQRKALEGILSASASRVMELTLSETNFKIEQLNREYQKNIEILNQNNATKDQMLILERAHALSIQSIRDEAYKLQKEKEAKRAEEEKKAKEEIQKKKVEEFLKEEERQSKHFDFLNALKKEQQDLILKNIEERDGWRIAELQRVQNWENDQFIALDERLAAGEITYQEYQDQLTAILETASMKRDNIEADSRTKNIREDNKRIDDWLKKIGNTISKITNIYQGYINNLTNLNEAYTQIRENELNRWYDSEYARIMDSTMSNEDREAAIEALDQKMHAKKAELEAAAAKREKALAIAQAIANTAVAITTALKSAPWPFNIPAIAFAIATGAAQIAAIGGAFKAPGVSDYAPPGEGAGGGAGGGAVGAPGGGIEAGAETMGGGKGPPAFQHGTGGYITPPSDFLVGEPYSPEHVRLRGNLQNVSMSVTPLRQTAPVSQNNGVNVHLDFSGMNVIDATDFENRVRDFLPRLMQQYFDNGIITINRSRIQ